MTVRRHAALAWSVGLAVGLGLLGCGPRIALDQGTYTPRIETSAFQPYRGRLLDMPGFTNRDEDTTIFYYYDAEKGRKYGGPSLTSFFWYAFQEAFESIGVTATDGGAPVGTPKLDIELLKINEQQFELAVTLSTAQTVFRRMYQVPGPPVTSEDERELEARAYHMVDLAFVAIVSDPGFQAAFLASQPPSVVVVNPTAAPQDAPPAPSLEPAPPAPPEASTW